MKGSYEIVIVGGGITGLTIAAMLASSSNADAMRVTLVDAAARPQFDPADDVQLRVSAIATGSAHLLDALGAWQHVIATRACPYDHMRVWDAADEASGPSTLRFDADEFAIPQLGFIVENLLVQDALLRVLDHSSVNLRFACSIESFHRHGEQVALIRLLVTPDLHVDV